MAVKLKDLNQEVQMLSLDILDFIIAEGKAPTWTQISSKHFLTNLISLLKTRDAPEVQEKILYLIQKWGVRFESQKEILPNFTEVYNSLKKSGVVFPDENLCEYPKYIAKGDLNISPNISSNNIIQGSPNRKPSNVNQNKSPIKSPLKNNKQNEYIYEEVAQPNYSKNVNLDLNPDNYDKKYKKFVTELSVLIDNIKLANEMIDNTQVGTPVDEGLRTIIHNLRELNNNLVAAIQDKIKNEKLLGICLGINDDINRTFSRYDALKIKKNPGIFISAFEEEYASSNTINKKESGSKQVQKEKPFDFFAVDDNNFSNNNKQPQKSNELPVKSVDDIFDIFNSNNNIQVSNNQNVIKPPIDSNNAPSVNFIQGMNNLNISGASSNQVPGTNTNVNTNKSQADILSEKLKSIYGEDGNNNNNNMNMNSNMMVKYNINFSLED